MAKPAIPATPLIHLPTWSHLRVATKQRTRVAKGGDFFEVFQYAGGRVAAVMADVAGNGPSAAVPVSDIRWVLRQHLARGESPGTVLRALNDWMFGESSQDRFVTAICAWIAR